MPPRFAWNKANTRQNINWCSGKTVDLGSITHSIIRGTEKSALLFDPFYVFSTLIFIFVSI